MGNGTAIKLTTARYFTPDGRSIQAKGIVPDIVVEDPANPSDEGFGIREADLERHLANPQGGAEDKTPIEQKQENAPRPEKQDKDRNIEKKPEIEPGEIVSKNDYQLNQALNLLKGLNIIRAQ